MGFHADRVAATLAEHGETCTLRRQTSADPLTYTDVSLAAKWFLNAGAATADALVGVQGQTTFRVMIANAEIAAASWPGPPRKGDLLVRAMNGRSYRIDGDADTRLDGNEVVAHFIVVSG